MRGLAALVVVLNHFITTFYPALYWGLGVGEKYRSNWEVPISNSFLNIFYNGNFAVCIFFILSGYVLSHKFFTSKNSEIITASASKRYFRLFIPVFFSTAIAFILLKLSLIYTQPTAVLSGSAWLNTIFTKTPGFGDFIYQSFIGTFFQHQSGYNVVLWTMTYELFGSFLIFAFMALFGKIKNRYLFYLATALIFFNGYYLSFILGLILSDIMSQSKNILNYVAEHKIFRNMLLIIGLLLGSYPTENNISGTYYSWLNFIKIDQPFILFHTIGAFLIMAVLLNSPKIQAFLSKKYFYWLGQISFSMYLLHILIISSFSSYLFIQLTHHLSYKLAFLISFALSLPLLFLLAYLFHKYIDAKAVKYSQTIYEKLWQNKKLEL